MVLLGIQVFASFLPAVHILSLAASLAFGDCKKKPWDAVTVRFLTPALMRWRIR
jgi:hypothetical protein